MNVADALRAGAGALVRAPAAVLPFYLLAAGADAAARTPLLVGAGLAALSLVRDGRIEPVVREARAFDPSTVDPEAGVEALPAGLRAAIEGLVTPTVVGLLAVGVLLAAVVWVLARSAVAAGGLHAGHAFVRGGDPAAVGAAGIAADWRTFVGLRLIRLAVVVGAVAAVGGVSAVSPVAGALVLLGAVAVVPLALLALAFAGQAVVVDRVGVGGAVRRSVRYPLSNPGRFLGYVGVASVAWGLAIGLAAVLGVAGAPRAGALATTFVVPPLVDTFKTGLYVEGPFAGRGRARDPGGERAPAAASADGGTRAGGAAPQGAGRVSVRGGLRNGLWALGRFVRDHPLAWLGSSSLLAAGGVAGYLAARRLDARLPLPTDRVAELGSLGAGGFVNLAANNWQVAVGAAFGGLGLGVPTVVTLGFNGLLIGAIGGVTEPRAFLALVAPHGVLELPAIAVAGGLGLHLAAVGWRWLRGRHSPQEVGAELTFALRVLVGLAVAFVVAAGIEAFVTARLAARLLGG